MAKDGSIWMSEREARLGETSVLDIIGKDKGVIIMAQILVTNARGQKEIKNVNDEWTKVPKEDLFNQSLPGVYVYVHEGRRSRQN